MGLESACRAHFRGQTSSGKARLEHKDLHFLGDFRFKISLSEIRSLRVEGDILKVETAAGAAVFELGARAAQAWFLKIRYPKKLLDKLGVKPQQRVGVVGVEDSEFLGRLQERTESAIGPPAARSDLIFLEVDAASHLQQLPQLREKLKQTGAIWVFWPKGQKHIKEGHVRQAAKAGGLVDVKVVSVSERLSGLKLMIPRKLRK